MTWGPRLIAINTAIYITLAGVTVFPTAAQDGQRKLVSKVEPEYPAVLKERHIGGVVKLQAIVRADGGVKAVELLGGNPALGEAAIKAVKQWRYVASWRETTEEVSIRFSSK